MSRYCAAFFDFDGVVVDSEPERFRTYEQLFKNEFGVDLNPDIYSRKGYPQDDNLRYFLKKCGISYDDTLVSFLCERRRSLLEKVYQNELSPICSVLMVMEALLKEDYPLAIVSNSCENYVRRALSNIGAQFDGISVFSGEDTGLMKPSPALYKKALRDLGLSSGTTLVFEDSRSGLRSAEGANMDVVFVRKNQELYNEFEPVFILDYSCKQDVIEYELLSLFNKD